MVGTMSYIDYLMICLRETGARLIGHRCLKARVVILNMTNRQHEREKGFFFLGIAASGAMAILANVVTNLASAISLHGQSDLVTVTAYIVMLVLLLYIILSIVKKGKQALAGTP